MKKIISKLLVFVFVMMIIMTNQSMQKVKAAGSVNVSVSGNSGEVGSDVSVSVTISASSQALGGEIYLSYDPGYIEVVSNSDVQGNAGTITIFETNSFTTITKTFSVRILKTGNSSISVANGKIPDENGDPMKVSGGSGTVTGVAPVTYSTDNNLASLSISPGTLSPAFSSSITSYTASVDADCTQLVVSAAANDSKASVSVSGTSLNPGDNTTTITVTAENGSTKTYTIYTTRAQSETETTKEEETKTVDKQIKINGVSYKVVSDLSEHPLPLGYEEFDLDYDGITIKAGHGINTKLTLIYLESVDGSGDSGFYIYDSVAKTFTLYTEVAEPEITYVILPITDSMEKPDGLTLMDYNINGVTAKVMMSSDRSYCVFYGISSTGTTGWFKYDCSDKTIQVYSATSTNLAINTDTENVKNDNSSRMWQLIAIVAGIIAVILLIVVFVLISKLVNKNYDADDDLDKIEDDSDALKIEEDMGDILEDIAKEDSSDDDFEELELFDVDEKNK